MNSDNCLEIGEEVAKSLSSCKIFPQVIKAPPQGMNREIQVLIVCHELIALHSSSTTMA